MSLVVIVLLLLLIVGGLPFWGSHTYGYGPSGLVGAVLVVLVLLMVLGRL